MSKRSRSRSNARSGSDDVMTPRPTPESESEPDAGSSSPILDLLVVFVIVYALQQVAAVVGAMAGLFVLAPPLQTNPWTVVTSVYAHGGIGHLLSNALALVVFGWPIARATSRVRFHLFFATTGALAGVSQVVVTRAVLATPFVAGGATPGVLGASGAVFALLGYLVASNRLSVGLASFVEVPQWVAILVFVGLAMAVTLATAAPGVALIAHFTGFLLGVFAGRGNLLRPSSAARR